MLLMRKSDLSPHSEDFSFDAGNEFPPCRIVGLMFNNSNPD